MSVTRRLIPPPGSVRLLAVSGLARAVAFGAVLTIGALYAVRTVGVPAGQAGLAMTIAAACGMVTSLVAGRAADTAGARTVVIVLAMVQGTAVCGYPLVTGFWGFTTATSLVIGCHSASEATRGAIIATLGDAGDRVRTRAYLHAVTNVGLALGSVLGGVALHADSRAMYTALFLLCGALFTASGLVCAQLPAGPPAVRSRHARSWTVFRDRPFALFILLNTLLVMNDSLLTVVLPLWIAEHTAAPVTVYSVILVLNTAVVVLFQVPVSRGAGDLDGGTRALRRSGVLLAACCALFALAADRPPGLAIALLVAGALVHVVGELLYSVGSWALAFTLAPNHAHGEYQGVFTMSIQFGGMVAPVVGTTLVLGTDGAGWLAFAALLLAAGLAAPAVPRLVGRTR